MHEGSGWIVDADVRGYFDSIDRTQLREALRHRVNDGRLVRLIGKWLRAGVMAEGGLNHPETGVVQGGARPLGRLPLAPRSTPAACQGAPWRRRALTRPAPLLAWPVLPREGRHTVRAAHRGLRRAQASWPLRGAG